MVLDHYFQGFLNVHLVLKKYPIDTQLIWHIGLVETVIKLARFVPLLEKMSNLLDKFIDFTKELQSFFGDTNSVRIAINKIERLWQGDHLVLAYQLIVFLHVTSLGKKWH